jgi:hypothetical protein
MIVLCTLICIPAAKAQNLRADMFKYGVYDTRKGYQYTKFEDVDIAVDFYLKSNFIYFHTRIPFTVTVSKMIEPLGWDPLAKGKTTLWQAQDDRKHRCQVRFTFYDTGSMQVMVFYEDAAFVYQFTHDDTIGIDSILDN